MSFCLLNGMEIPVRAGSLRETITEVGERNFAEDGTPMSQIRARKRGWQFTTKPMTFGQAEMWRALLSGIGHTWSFDADLWSAQGLYATPSNAAVTVSTAQKKFGAKSLILPASAYTATIALPASLGASYAVAFWYRDAGGTWGHYVFFSVEGIAPTGVWGFKNGVAAEDIGGPASLSGSDLVLTANGGAATYVDDLVLVPTGMATIDSAEAIAFAAGLAPLGVACPAIPSVRLNGDVVGSEAVNVVARANDRRVTYAGATSYYELDVELREA